MTVRLVVDETTMGELMAWHEADRPECLERSVLLTGSGFGCPCCGWHVETDDASGTTT